MSKESLDKIIMNAFRGSPCKEPGTCYGGVARRVTAINKIRADTEHENILILDAGDQSQGTRVNH